VRLRRTFAGFPVDYQAADRDAVRLVDYCEDRIDGCRITGIGGLGKGSSREQRGESRGSRCMESGVKTH
jgi:hypothetical protein